MATYKVICTITWTSDCQDEHSAAKLAREQLNKILNAHPEGEEYRDFRIQMDIAKRKDRKKMIHLGVFSLDDVFPHITIEESKKDYVVEGHCYSVKMNSDRYHVFKANNACVCCGLKGTRMILDMNPGDNLPHFNLYAEEYGRLILMTKDHIVAKSKGGKDIISNFQTCCEICNSLKADWDLSQDQVRELRLIWQNEEKLSRKSVKHLINKRREEFAAINCQLTK